VTKTNFEKLVGWDADFYKELSDDDCIVCLTEREVYIIGQITNALRWKATRWIGDIAGLDFDLIASNLEYKLSERMTCQNITTLLEKLQSLETKIDYIFEQTATDNGDVIPDETTTAWDVTTPEEFSEDFTYTTDGCDTEDKDALYGAIFQLVRYVNQVNIDALQQLSQIGNVAQQIDKLISAATGGLTPLDEVAGYVDFLVNELLEEYEATVDEELLETVTCDLFCIAVSSNCSINMSDVINYYGSKIGSTALDLTSSLANVMQFAAIGTFSGDEYFYFMTTFQFITVALTDHFFNVDSMSGYMTQLAAGANSPDNDWTLLCDACPPLYRKLTVNFAYGQGDWIAKAASGDPAILGTFTGSRWHGTETTDESRKAVYAAWDDFDPTWRVRDVKIYHEQTGAPANAANARAVKFRPTIDSTTGEQTPIASSGLTNGVFERCGNFTTYGTGFHQCIVQLVCVNDEDSQVYLDKVEFLFELNYAPDKAVITEDDDICV